MCAQACSNGCRREAYQYAARVKSPAGSSAGPPLADLRRFHPGTRPWPASRGDITGIRELAAVERQAAAANAFGEPGAQPFELGDARLDAFRPAGRQLRPVLALRHPVARQPGELGANLLER